jgi:glycosyltransferase involved in cell wall biosynthesis
VNPIPEKGLGIAVEVARLLTDEHFLFVEGGWPDVQNDATLLSEARALPNVELWPYQSDMREVYAVTDILLMPSQLTESFGRVVIEAQVNGIPVVAADAGGLPFTVGEGGLLIGPRDDVDAYVVALRSIRSDPDLRARLSRAALENSCRPEFKPARQVRAFVDFVEARLDK